MKKQLVIKAIIIILVVIIAISSILVYVVLNGEVTSIKDIQEYPNRYINQTVTVTGTFNNYSDIVAAFVDASTGTVTDESGRINIIIPMNVKQPAPFDYFAKYRFIGIVRYGEVFYEGPGVFPGPGIYLEITKIETT
jgi:hypothetical protein